MRYEEIVAMKLKRKIRIRSHASILVDDSALALAYHSCANCVHWSPISLPVSVEGGCTNTHSDWYHEPTGRRHLCGNHEGVVREYSRK